MNIDENELENILRHPPRPAPPGTLKQRLISQINVRAASDESAESILPKEGIAGWLRRWWPALAPATVSLACAAIMVSQRIEARDLRRNNDALAAQVAAEKARVAIPVTNQKSADDAESDWPGQKEIARLKERAAQLGSEVARLEALRNENQALRKQPLTTASGLTEEELEKMKEAKEKAMSIACINNLKQIGLAVHVYANDVGGVCPPDMVSMSKELSTPKILVCPADTNRAAATSFAQYTDANCSYEFLTPSVTNAFYEPQRVMTRCPIHGHIGLCDGSVQSEVAKKHPERLVMSNRKLYLNPDAPGK